MTNVQNAWHHVICQTYVRVDPPSYPFSSTVCSLFVLANVTAGCCCGKLELIGGLAKMSQVVTPEAQMHFPY